MNANIYYFSALLAFAGGAFSFYFYSVYCGWISYRQWWVPRFCEIDSGKCISIVDSKYGRMIGIPNAIIGSFFMLCYAFILFAVPLDLIDKSIPLYMGCFSILVGLYLVYGLFRLRVTCPNCITVHIINVIIFILQLL